MSELKPPLGVRVVHADGKETPCEVTYIGIDDDNCHQWSINHYVDFDNGDTVAVEMMPARTGIQFSANTSKLGQFGVEWRDTPSRLSRWFYQILRVKKTPT